jgi:hypothetical protein
LARPFFVLEVRLNRIFVVSFKPKPKNTLLGFLSIRLSAIGITIREVALHEKNGKRWVSFPARSYKREDGAVGWESLIEYISDEARQEFQNAALAAVDEFFEQAEASR